MVVFNVPLDKLQVILETIFSADHWLMKKKPGLANQSLAGTSKTTTKWQNKKPKTTINENYKHKQS